MSLVELLLSGLHTCPMSASFCTATCTPSITNPIYPRPSLGPTCIQWRHVLNDNHLLIRGGSKPFEVGKSGSYSGRNLFWRQLFSSNVHDCVVALVTHGPWLHPGYCIYGMFFFPKLAFWPRKHPTSVGMQTTCILSAPPEATLYYLMPSLFMAPWRWYIGCHRVALPLLPVPSALMTADVWYLWESFDGVAIGGISKACLRCTVIWIYGYLYIYI